MAMALASSAKYADEIGGLMTFGGFSDWSAVALFCLTGQVDGEKRRERRDPLNQPAVFINLVDHIEGAPEDTRPLCDAWRRYCRATWGSEEHKRTSSRKRVAKAIAAELDPSIQTLFLTGCGAGKVSNECAIKVIREHSNAWSFLRFDDRLGRVVCPVRIVHARDDDVIPSRQAELIASHLPVGADVRVFLTDLYGHSGPETGALGLHRARGAAREVGTMLGVIRSMAALAVDR
jgi:pimeloyl-ACP methyl ester carboxylesterase